MINPEDENIIISINDKEDKNQNNNINISDELNNILNELENKKISNSLKLTNDNLMEYVQYKLVYKLKDLHLICEYYNILKEVKSNKCNKDEIINIILEFENNINNINIINKRKNMWFYINEIKNDKLLKKYLLL